MRTASKHTLTEEYFDCSTPLFNELDKSMNWIMMDGQGQDSPDTHSL